MPRPGKWTVVLESAGYFEDMECKDDAAAEKVYTAAESRLHSTVTLSKYNSGAAQIKTSVGKGTVRPGR